MQVGLALTLADVFKAVGLVVGSICCTLALVLLYAIWRESHGVERMQKDAITESTSLISKRDNPNQIQFY